MRSHFLPEFLNRMSSTVIFNRLAKSEIRKIVDLRLAEIQQRLHSNHRNVNIDVDEKTKDYLAAAGYSPQYGARPLGRVIEKEILNRLSVLLLRGSVRDGETAKVRMDSQGRVVVESNHEADEGMEDEDMEDMEWEGSSDGDEMEVEELYD